MALNTATFGSIVSARRGDRTKEAIKMAGGPTRQRQALIERGDPVLFTDALLSQLELIFDWPFHTIKEVLNEPRRPNWPDKPRWSTLGNTDLGFDSERNPVGLPRVLAVESLAPLMPLVKRWKGPVLIDAGDPFSVGRPVWLTLASDIPVDRWRRVGNGMPADVEPIAVDPFPAIRSMRTAVQLLGQLRWLAPAAGRDTQSMALTMLFVAHQSTVSGDSGLSVLSALSSDEPGDDLVERWRQFFAATGFSSRHEHINKDVLSLLRPLLEIRDANIQIELRGEDIVSYDDVQTLTPADLAGLVIFYDAKKYPLLPALVDVAYDASHPGPLVITEAEFAAGVMSEFRNAGVDEQNPVRFAENTLPNSHVIIKTPAAELGASTTRYRTPACSRLVQPNAGSAVLLPDDLSSRRDGVPSQRVWLADTSLHLSNKHLNTNEPGQALAFYQQHRSRFGVFVKATMNDPQRLALTDDTGRRLDLWGAWEDFHQSVATILSDNSFGDLASLLTVVRSARERPFTLAREAARLTMPVGTAADGSTVDVDLTTPGIGYITGDPDIVTTLITHAATLLCQGRAVTELTVLGMTTGAARPWVPVADLPHSAAFIGPWPGVRDSESVAAWFNERLADEVKRRRHLLLSGRISRRSTLVVIVDGVDRLNITGPARTKLLEALRINALEATQLDVRIILCGATALDEFGPIFRDIATMFDVQVASRDAAHSGNDADRVVGSLRRGESAELGVRAEPFRPWTPAATSSEPETEPDDDEE